MELARPARPGCSTVRPWVPGPCGPASATPMAMAARLRGAFLVHVEVVKMGGPVDGADQAKDLYYKIRVVAVPTEEVGSGVPGDDSADWKETPKAGPNPNSASGAQQLSN